MPEYMVMVPTIEKRDGSHHLEAGDTSSMSQYSKAQIRHLLAKGAIALIVGDEEEEEDDGDWQDD